MYIVIQEKYLLFLLDFNHNFDFLDRFSKNIFNIKSHENSPSGSRVAPCGRTDEGQTGITKCG